MSCRLCLFLCLLSATAQLRAAEAPRPQAGSPAKAEPAPLQPEGEPSDTRKLKALKDFYARVNKDFLDVPRHFQYSDGVLMGEYGIDPAWDTAKYDVIMKEPEFTVTTTATADQPQGDPITGTATTDPFKLGDIEELKLDAREGKLTITLYHTIHTAYPDFESNWTANGVSWQVIETGATSREVVLARNARFALNRVPVDKQLLSRLRALRDFLKAALEEYRKLTGRNPGSRILE